MPMGPCLTHCPKEKGGGFLAAAAAVGAVVLVAAVVAWLTANWLPVLGAAVALSAVAAVALRALSVASRKLARLSVPRWSNYHATLHQRVMAPVRAEVQPRALRAPPRAIEGQVVRVALTPERARVER